MKEALEFMGAAFYGMLGVVCVVVAIALIFAVFVGLRNAWYTEKIKRKAAKPWKGGTRHD